MLTTASIREHIKSNHGSTIFFNDQLLNLCSGVENLTRQIGLVFNFVHCIYRERRAESKTFRINSLCSMNEAFQLHDARVFRKEMCPIKYCTTTDEYLKETGGEAETQLLEI